MWAGAMEKISSGYKGFQYYVKRKGAYFKNRRNAASDGSSVRAFCTVAVIADTEETLDITPVSPTPKPPKTEEAPKEGDTVTDSRTSAVYRIRSLSTAEADYISPTNKRKNIKVPDSVALKGIHKNAKIKALKKKLKKYRKILKKKGQGKNVKIQQL